MFKCIICIICNVTMLCHSQRKSHTLHCAIVIGGEELRFEVCVAKAVDLCRLCADEELMSVSTQGNRGHSSLQLHGPVRAAMRPMSMKTLSERPPNT